MATTSVMNTFTVLCPKQDQLPAFHRDVLTGLNAKDKYLDAKYFYDDNGDRIFQQIMACPEYYPTRCEMEIMREQSVQISAQIASIVGSFDVIELGAGDATKSVHLLQELLNIDHSFTYFPIDISANVIRQLEQSLPEQLPALQVHGLNGEYFEMLRTAQTLSSRPKVILCMGGNIGNFTPAETRKFCRQLRHYLQPGDLLLTGFDLKKHPQIILNAYNDAAGITRAFNLNLLHRINREMDADFDVSKFDHYPTYDPGTGACKSYLVSLEDQQVHVGGEIISFKMHEAIFMEISQKYTLDETEKIALQAGFEPVSYFTDQKGWFADCLWQA
jgi:dimethylhistidine N-methyltransferase